jgi:putative ABC transport system substrate-binding protein
MQRKRLSLLCLAVLDLIGLNCCKSAVEEKKSHTVGIININPTMKVMVKGFKAGMAEKGYIEGQNIAYLYGDQLLKKKELAGAFDDLVSSKPDLVYVLSTPAARQTASALKDKGIPIVFAGVYDPVRTGLLSTPKKPDTNITGIKVGGGTAKALEWLLRISPGTGKIYVPLDNNDKAAMQSLANLKKGAQNLQVELLVNESSNPEELKKVLNAIPDEADALFILNGVLNATHIDAYVQSAIKHQLPLAGGIGFENGIPIFFGQDRFNTGKQASRLAHDILLNTPVSMIPVENAELFLRINLKNGQASGLTISNEILHLADEIIH